MAYRVIKWVKGHAYAYLQRSFREGGTVRTVSEYLGPVDPADAPHKEAKTRTSGKGAGDGSSPPKAEKTAKEEGASPADSSRSATKQEKTTEERKAVRAVAEERIRIDPRIAKKGLSERVARRHHKNMIGALSNLGIPSDRVPFVAVQYGKGLAVKPRWRGGFVVTVPRFDKKLKQRDVRAAFRLALGRAALEALRTEKPELFGQLSLAMDPGFHRTSSALLAYVRAGGRKDAWTWWVAHRFLGYANPLPGRKAEEVGLAGYGARKNWTDDAAGIVGKLVSSGWTATAAEADREVGRAKAAEINAFDALRNARGIMGRIRRPELRRRHRAAIARRDATTQAKKNVQIVRSFLTGKKDDGSSSE